MTKSKKNIHKNNNKLDKIDKLLFNLATKNSETPKHIEETVKKTINNIFK